MDITSSLNEHRDAVNQIKKGEEETQFIKKCVLSLEEHGKFFKQTLLKYVDDRFFGIFLEKLIYVPLD